MLKAKLFNYIALICAIFTIAISIYTIYAKANSFLCIIFLILTLLLATISNYINKSQEKITKKDIEFLDAQREQMYKDNKKSSKANFRDRIKK